MHDKILQGKVVMKRASLERCKRLGDELEMEEGNGSGAVWVIQSSWIYGTEVDQLSPNHVLDPAELPALPVLK